MRLSSRRDDTRDVNTSSFTIVTRATGANMRRHVFRPSLESMEGRLLLSALGANHSVAVLSLTPPSVQVTATATQVDLSWKAVSGAASYTVDQYTSRGWVVIANTPRTSFVGTGLAPATSYWFDVAARSASSWTWATPTKVTTLSAIPAAPTLSASAVSSSQVDLSWNAVSGATSYTVDEYTARGWTEIASTSSTSFVATDLTPATSYSFDVAARNASGLTWATPKNATTLSAIPAAPTLSASAVSSSQANLSWNAVSGATSYTVDEYTARGWIEIASTSATGFVVTGLAGATSYSFDVAARNTSGWRWSTPNTVTTPVPTIPPPTQASETTTTTTTQSDLGLVNIYPGAGIGTSWTWSSTLSSWINAQFGQRVGNGQCADLANQALINNGYETFYQTGGPTGTNANYVWGKLVATITTANCKTIPSALFQSTVILQFSNATFEHTAANADGSYTTTYDNASHHTAIVTGGGSYSYSDGTGDWYINVFEQNANGIQKVTSGQYFLPDMTGGTIWVYEPIRS